MNNRLVSILKLISFLVIFSLLFSYFNRIFPRKWVGENSGNARTNAFYILPKDSIDVLFIGASSFLNGISPLTVWENYGFTSYNRAFAGLAPIVAYYYLIESLNYQTPKVVVLDVNSIYREYDYSEKEGRLRESIDPLKISPEKIQLVREIVSASNDQSIISYIFPFFRYHSRWNELKKVDFSYKKKIAHSPLKGFLPTYKVDILAFPINFMNQDLKAENVAPISLSIFKRLINICHEKNIEIVFVTMPRTDWTYSKHLGIEQFANESNAFYIDYSLRENIDRIKFDSSSDFLNPLHVNANGALKVSKDLGDILQKRYQLVDNRKMQTYSKWNLDTQKLKDAMDAGWANSLKSD